MKTLSYLFVFLFLSAPAFSGTPKHSYNETHFVQLSEDGKKYLTRPDRHYSEPITYVVYNLEHERLSWIQIDKEAHALPQVASDLSFIVMRPRTYYYYDQYPLTFYYLDGSNQVVTKKLPYQAARVTIMPDDKFLSLRRDPNNDGASILDIIDATSADEVKILKSFNLDRVPAAIMDDIVVSPDGKLAYLRHSAWSDVVNLETGEKTHFESVYKPQFSKNRLVVSGSKQIHVFDSDVKRLEIDIEDKNWVNSEVRTKISPNGLYLASILKQHPAGVKHNKELFRWKIKVFEVGQIGKSLVGKPLYEIKPSSLDFGQIHWELVYFSPDSKILVSSYAEPSSLMPKASRLAGHEIGTGNKIFEIAAADRHQNLEDPGLANLYEIVVGKSEIYGVNKLDEIEVIDLKTGEFKEVLASPLRENLKHPKDRHKVWSIQTTPKCDRLLASTEFKPGTVPGDARHYFEIFNLLKR